jgi:hypothetical protein
MLTHLGIKNHKVCVLRFYIKYNNRIQAAEIKYLTVRLDQIRNEDIRNELDISPLSEKSHIIQE